MRGLVDLVEVSCFIGWDEGFCGTVDFFDVMSKLVLKFVMLVSKFNVLTDSISFAKQSHQHTGPRH